MRGGSFLGDPRDELPSRRSETTESLLPKAVGDRPNQEGSADLSRRNPAVEGLLALAKILDIGLCKACDFHGECCSVRSRRTLLQYNRPLAYFSTIRSLSKPICGPPINGRCAASDVTDIPRFAPRIQSCGLTFCSPKRPKIVHRFWRYPAVLCAIQRRGYLFLISLSNCVYLRIPLIKRPGFLRILSKISPLQMAGSVLSSLTVSRRGGLRSCCFHHCRSFLSESYSSLS
jgi:hypothetical protein